MPGWILVESLFLSSMTGQTSLPSPTAAALENGTAGVLDGDDNNPINKISSMLTTLHPPLSEQLFLGERTLITINKRIDTLNHSMGD